MRKFDQTSHKIWYLHLFNGKCNFGVVLGPVPERPISANPGLKFCCTFCIYLPTYSLE